MSPFDIVAVVVISVAFIAVVGTVIYKKVKHKGGGCGDCSCGCSGCSLHGSCSHANGDKPEK